ncbi:MRAP protein, partial [Amia calva]|nr:MRAP protein [Amia calva]
SLTMKNNTNTSEYVWTYEYFYDYIDPVVVDEKQLRFNKYTIVILFWVGLAGFVAFLFLILLQMSRSGNVQPR